MARSTPTRREVAPGVWIDTRRALFLDEPQALIVADIHWGYAVAHRAAGNLLPMWGDDEIARGLSGLIEHYRPREFIWLGDSLHTLDGRRAAEEFIRSHAERVSITILGGNHDRKWTRVSATEHSLGCFYLRHGDDLRSEPPTDCVEIVGHHHPALSMRDGAGGRVRIPALVASPRRLILPAFSPWAAGVEWNQRLAVDDVLWALAPSRIFAVTREKRDQPATP